MTPKGIYAIHGDNPLDYDGWTIRTEGLGRDPNNHHGADYSGMAHTPIVRLNHGYHPHGTIPLPEHYGDFAQRVANFVAASRGCSRWIIGNEMNHEQERPYGQPIEPDQYARCFNMCYSAIHALDDHKSDEVLVGAVAPWNNQTKYLSNPSGDWIRYFEDVQRGIAGCDGFALHTYSREQTPSGVTSNDRMGPPFEHYHNGFRTYTDWMAAILTKYRGLPCYITETNAIVPWKDINTGFVQRAYQEIFTWNGLHPDQLIHCLALYRWQYDQWEFKDKQHVIDDFMLAVNCNYTVPPLVEPDPPDYEQRIEALEEQSIQHAAQIAELYDRLSMAALALEGGA